jgi:alpha-D-ribose 1-methylphosphonate 5-triphosphate synthase subunit PhnI
MNTDDYIKRIDNSLERIAERVSIMDKKIEVLEMKQSSDEKIKAFFISNWASILALLTLWGDLYYTYKTWIPPKH